MNYSLYKIICLGAIIGFTLLVVLLLVDRSRVTSIDSESYAHSLFTQANSDRSLVMQMKWDSCLAEQARAKAKEMIEEQYFAHTAP